MARFTDEDTNNYAISRPRNKAEENRYQRRVKQKVFRSMQQIKSEDSLVLHSKVLFCALIYCTVLSYVVLYFALLFHNVLAGGHFLPVDEMIFLNKI